MNWLAVLPALAKLVLAVLDMARERQAKGAGRAEAIAESTTHALELIAKARAARRAAADAAADPISFYPDNYRWVCFSCLLGVRCDPMARKGANGTTLGFNLKTDTQCLARLE
jgi:hypothetical protein